MISSLQEQRRLAGLPPLEEQGKEAAESAWNKAWAKLTPMLAAWGIQAPRVTANEAGLDALRKILGSLKKSDGPYHENMWSAVASMHDAMRRIVEPGSFGDSGQVLAKSFPAKLASARKHAAKAKKNIASYKELKPQIDTLKNHPNLRSNKFLWSLYNQLYAHGKPLSPKQQAVLDKILGEETSDGWEYSGGPGCDVCGYGSVENVDVYDPSQPCPDCGITMVTGPHNLSEGLLAGLEKTLLKFNVKHWDKVPGPIKALYKLLYGKKSKKVSAPAQAVAALSKQLAKSGAKPGAKGGIIIMQSVTEQRKLAGLEDYQEPLEEDDNIGRTILQQMGGAGRIKVMTGAGPFVLLPKGVSFKFPNKKRTRGNYVEITLRGDDTYNMEFFNVSVKGKKTVKKYTMIYNDQLISIFEDQTGLYLRL